MASFNKINIDGVPYDVEDTTARNSVTEEAEARAQAISAETTARQQAVTQLGQQISAETTARQQADTKLEADITELDNRVNTLENKHDSPYYNVKDYGAVGDGTTDDSTAIQKAMDTAMAAGGGTVVFPSGQYRISNTLVIRPHTAADNPPSSQNIHFLRMDRLILAGLGSVRILPDSSVTPAIKTDDFSYPANVGSFSNFYTVIRDLQIIGTSASGSTGIDLYNALHSIVSNVQIDGFATALSVRGYGEITVQDCTLRASSVCIYTSHAGDNLFIGNDLYSDALMIQTTGYSGSTKIIANTFTRNTDNATPTAIQLITTPNEQNGPYHIIANSFDYVGVGVTAFGSADNVIQGVWILQNKLAAGGLNNCLAQLTYADNCAIQSNTIPVQNEYDTTGYLFSATNCKNLVAQGNTVTKTQQTAIYLTSCTGAIAGNNFFDANGPYIEMTNCNGMRVYGNLFVSNGSNNALSITGSTGSYVINNTYTGYSSNPVPSKGGATVDTANWYGATQ